MIEKVVASAIEPIVDEILALEKRLDSIQLTPGPEGKPGKDAEVDVVELAVKLYELHGDKLKADPVDTDLLLKTFLEAHRVELKGEPGEPGKDGKDAEPVDYEILAKTLVDTHSDELRGAPGASVDAVDVALYLMQHHVEDLKGVPGKSGDTPDVEEIAQTVIKNDDFGGMMTKAALQLMQQQNELAISEINSVFE